MMGVKGKLLKKLKTIKTIGYLKPQRILQVNVSDAHFYTSPQKTSPTFPPPSPLAVTTEPEKPDCSFFPVVQEPEIIDVSELMKDLDDQDTDLEDEMDEKENLKPQKKLLYHGCSRSENSPGMKAKLDEVGVEKERGHFPLLEIDPSASSFRRPDLNSRTLFDPNLLAAFELAIMEAKAREAERRSRIIEVPSLWEDIDVVVERPLKTRKVKLSMNDDDGGDDGRNINPLLDFEEKCLPGGSDSIVVYTTGLRAVRKTFEDCQKMRSLLENMRVLFFERDISMHSVFKEELWEILGGKTVPPRLFIKGRYIGGVDEVIGLHEQGKLKPLVEGIPSDHHHSDGPCQGCVGFRFIVCFNCNGSQKIVPEGYGAEPMDCSECNENGMLVCPFCC